MKGNLFGLRTAIILNVTIIMVLAVFLISFVVLRIMEKNILDQNVRIGQTIIQSIANALDAANETALDSQEGVTLRQSFEKAARSYSENATLRELTLVGQNLEVIASVGTGFTARAMDDDLEQAMAAGEVVRGFVWTRDETGKNRKALAISAPIIQNDKVIGGLKGVFSLQDMETTVSESQKIVLFYIVLDALVLIVLGSVLLNRYLVRPIQRLTGLTEEIAAGDLGQMLEPTGANEIGKLSTSLNRMSERLREDRENIDRYIQSLREANEQLKRTQEELVRSEKMASVGRLAAGLAHEIGNPLGVILGYVDLLQKHLTTEGERADYLRRIEDEINKMNKVIRDLLDFSRPSPRDVGQIDVNRVVEECISLVSFQKTFQATTVSLRLKEKIPTIWMDPHQLQQVLVNLILNALDAMPQGGGLTVETHPAAESSGVEIRIEDTGEGIGAEDLYRIFDPFFTTKGPGKGTGLGLTICHRIVESWGGHVAVRSTLAVGTTFTVTLPRGRPPTSDKQAYRAEHTEKSLGK
jgi:signal transduction histidine kinase